MSVDGPTRNEPFGAPLMNILAIDVGGSHVKMLATGQTEPTRIDSGPELTPTAMVAGVREATASWSYDVISVGVPAPVRRGAVLREPQNLGPGWVGFDFEAAFGKPVRLVNDAAMQALGSYEGGTMLFLGLGTGLGATVISDGHVFPLEIAHLSYKRATYEHYAGAAGLERAGRKTWEERVHHMAEELRLALVCDTVVLGGGNARKLKDIPEHMTRGDNGKAFVGGFRLWNEPDGARAAPLTPTHAG